ncbi:oligoribonuclease-like protein [Lineolata rhizophorae]|uniref:Oligoribonuclease-like protein n=1 Tax=Lineolata rhizophorae TaxID=578093 RepID=A0A6A6NNE1_9PEZI|nr:oligoribonuclease-like protein [Lineolata rhizophorae]
MTSRSTDPLVWIDCEMTGLDTNTDTILQIACYVTDASLNLLDRTGYETVIHHSEAALSAMGPWCQEHHSASGLTAVCLASTVTAERAADELLAYIRRFVPSKRTALLAGNSVHADRAFLVKPPYDRVLAHLHYRILDVSTLKEAVRRWAPEHVLRDVPRKANKHEARADILESIEEARFYRETLFSGPRKGAGAPDKGEAAA